MQLSVLALLTVQVCRVGGQVCPEVKYVVRRGHVAEVAAGGGCGDQTRQFEPQK